MEMEVIVERCAFLDVHRDTVMACARIPDGHGGRREDVVEFRTTTSQLLALAVWLTERQVSLVGMEATGVYWKPVHWVLEAHVAEVWVINARHMRNLPGRKTDVADAIWGASLLEHGLVRPSFIPPPPFRALRDEMAKGRLRSKIAQLEDAMAGRFNEHHALLCQTMLAASTKPTPPSTRSPGGSRNCWPPTKRRCRCW
jgi:hypothetical protein